MNWDELNKVKDIEKDKKIEKKERKLKTMKRRNNIEKKWSDRIRNYKKNFLKEINNKRK